MTSFRLPRRRRRLPWVPDADWVAVVRILLHLQAGFALVSAIGALALGAFTGLLVVLLPTIAVTALGGIAAIALVPRLERGSRRARRLVVIGERVVLTFAVVDLGLAIGLAHAPLDLVAALTRVALPLAVLRLLRRPREPRKRVVAEAVVV
ncbi:MAG: hypothetical protein ACKVUT_18280 [Gaiella sp.]